MVFKMLPGFTRQVCFGVDKRSHRPTIDTDLRFYIYRYIFTLFGIFPPEALGELPDKIRVSRHAEALFPAKVIARVYEGGATCGFIHNPELYLPGPAPQHHPPAHPVAFFRPENIIAEQVVAEGQKQLDKQENAPAQKDIIAQGWPVNPVDQQGGLISEKNLPDRFRFEEEKGECQGQIWEDSNLKNNGIKEVETYRTDKGNFPGGFPEQGGYYKQVEEDADRPYSL